MNNTLLGVLIGSLITLTSVYMTNKSNKRKDIFELFKYALDLTNSKDRIITERGIALLRELVKSKITQKENLKIIKSLLEVISEQGKE